MATQMKGGFKLSQSQSNALKDIKDWFINNRSLVYTLSAVSYTHLTLPTNREV